MQVFPLVQKSTEKWQLTLEIAKGMYGYELFCGSIAVQPEIHNGSAAFLKDVENQRQ